MPFSLAFVMALIADCGIRWVLKLTSVPSMSKKSALIISYITYIH
jgi:hypothetical protein